LQCLFAKSPVDGTPLQTRASTLPWRRKYRTGQFRNAVHNCSRETFVITVSGFTMPATEKPEVVDLNCARVHSLCSSHGE
jgi:hypothetical protein